MSLFERVFSIGRADPYCPSARHAASTLTRSPPRSAGQGATARASRPSALARRRTTTPASATDRTPRGLHPRPTPRQAQRQQQTHRRARALHERRLPWRGRREDRRSASRTSPRHCATLRRRLCRGSRQRECQSTGRSTAGTARLGPMRLGIRSGSRSCGRGNGNGHRLDRPRFRTQRRPGPKPVLSRLLRPSQPLLAQLHRNQLSQPSILRLQRPYFPRQPAAPGPQHSLLQTHRHLLKAHSRAIPATPATPRQRCSPCSALSTSPWCLRP